MENAHKKNPWDVLNVHPRLTSSVVVTLVQVMHRETSWPASNDNTNRLVHKLFHRAPKLEKKALEDDQSIGGRVWVEVATGSS
jgi:hypothetical protein